MYTEEQVAARLRKMRADKLTCNIQFEEQGWNFSSASNVVSATFKSSEPTSNPVKGRMATLSQIGWEFGRSSEVPKFIDYTFYPRNWHCCNCGFPSEDTRDGKGCPSCGM